MVMVYISVLQNRSKALSVLRAKLFDLQLQASLEQQSQKRKEQIGTAERFERIRTYNFPQVLTRCSVTHYRVHLFILGTLGTFRLLGCPYSRALVCISCS